MTFSGANQTISGSDPGEVTEAPQPVCILFLAANPDGTSPLRLDREIKAITEALQTSPGGNRFEIAQSWAAGDREIQDGLLRYKPGILHLSGHGNRTGRPVLEGETAVRDLHGSGSRSSTSSRDDLWLLGLLRVFGAVRGQTRCVVLNICHSEAIAQALAQVTGCALGMSDAIGDEAAIRFSWSFYNALGHGLSVKAAFDAATGQIAMGGWPMDSTPRLITAGVDPANLTFA